MENDKKKGHFHPMTTAIREMYSIFDKMGYEIALGPELEEEFYNFDALNVPADHPARDMQDTFWIKNQFPHGKRRLMRTQTSAVQIRYMEKNKPPFKIFVPGKVFRNEATDATHEVEFFQIEGLVVGKDISLAHLKGAIEQFLKLYFGQDVKFRIRPSYFPFVEPGIEVDVWYKGKWMELLGAGLVHPNVLKASGIDSTIWSGFAFGMGFDRFVMTKYNIDDIRLLYSGDLRLVNQF